MVDEPRADRYLVSFATLGGQYGNGAVIKYDRVTHETTSVPLGNSTPGLPLGQPLQLENGLVLGGTLNRVGAALNPQRSKVGVWTLDLTTKVMQDYALPDTDSIRNDGRWYTRAVAAPKRFAKTENGDIWAAVIYEAFDPLAPFIAGNDYSTLIAGLVAFDSETGEPSGELHLLGGSESISDANFTGVTAHGQILSFVSPALRVEDNNTTGQRMWLIDIDIRDSDGLPSSNFLLFSPDVNSIAMGAWKIPFAATADNESGNLYIMTTAVESNVEMRIHRIALGDTISSTPTLTTVISGPADGLIDLPGTPLY